MNKINGAKNSEGKLKWRLVNLKYLEGLVRVREYGNKIYSDPENWRAVNIHDIFDALKRHIVEMDNKGIFSLDKESGLPHIWHILCNTYFLCAFFHDDKRNKEITKED